MWKTFLKTLVLIIGLSPLVIVPALAKDAPVYTSWRNNLAVGGYDTVSYHQGSPSKGNPDFTTNWHGAVWQFSSRANLESFLETPEKYAPAYGGYCAWAVANEKLAKGSPEHWSVKDGRLFLNYNTKIKTRWVADQDKFIQNGDANWPSILDE